MFNTKVVLILIGLMAGVAQAQETVPSLTIDGAISEGLGRSPDIAKAQAIKSETEWKHFEAMGAGFLPKVEANAHHFFDEKYSITGINLGAGPLTFPGFYPTDTVTLNAMIPIFDGLMSTRRLQAASLVEDAAAAELDHAQFQLRMEIRLAFYKSLAAAQLQEVAEQDVKTLEDHLKQIETRKHGGVATNYDVLRVQVQLNEAKADAIDAEDALATARKKLTQLLGLENDMRPLMGTLPLPVVDHVKDLKLSETPADRSDIRALNLRADAAHREKQARASWFVPQISVGGEYQWYNAQNFDGQTIANSGNYWNSYNVGVMLKWNLFDGGVSIAQDREAAERMTQARKTAEAEKLKVPYDFEYWKRRYLSNTDHYISKKFDITRSEESVRLAKEEERAGTRTSTETLDAEQDLFRAKAGVVNALVNAAEAEIRLEQVLGREI
jgi:outer membrane protein TolC